MLFLGLLGAVLFAGALFMSYADPLLVERGARELIRLEVERQIGETVDSLSGSRIAGFAARALGRTDARIVAQKRRLREDASARVADVAANMLDADCPCRQRLRALQRVADRNALVAQLQVRERLTAFVEATYASVSQSLIREFRIFTGSNAVAFALLALVAFARKRAKLQLLLPAIAIVGAVGVAGSLYLFNQDWLHTIVFGDYLGWGYAIYLSGLALMLGDILVNRARLTTQIVNGLLLLFGAVASATPC
jgi:hypothetical protein